MLPTLDKVVSRIDSFLEPEQVRLVKRAYYFAEQAHDGQFRRSGEPYVTHPLAVAEILSDMRMDHQSLIAALLHDVIEDTPVTKAAIEAQFGQEVAGLVDGVTKLTHLEFETKKEEQAENFQKMALAMADDIRVILVKLADRLHNMRTLGAMPPVKKRRIARETLHIYAPIALRLGLNETRIELEDLCFKAIFPMRSRFIEAAVKKSRGNRKELIEQVKLALEKRLQADGLSGRIIGREKHLYSIYQKMRTKEVSFQEIMDVYGFRIMTDSVDSCYRILGSVHNLYKPIPGRFKDYIAIPKVNGYQSLHTSLQGMNQIPIEVQIRTEDMEVMANNGIAAHWLYKSGSVASNLSHTRARAWVKGLLEMQHQAGNPIEFIENVKIDLFPDDIYVFTPKGRIMELPRGATAIDFAYAVHTDIGNSCVGCLVNKKTAPLSQALESGDTIKIMTLPNAQPSATWLSFVVTGKARAALRHYLKNRQRSESITLGRQFLDQSLASMGTQLQLVSNDRIAKLVSSSEFSDFDDLLEDIGLGNRMAFIVAKNLAEPSSDHPVGQMQAINISDSDSMTLKYAKCCRPIPGDPILGIISAGRGMVVHLDSCKNILDQRRDANKSVPLRWDAEMKGEFLAELRIAVHNQRGVIAMLASAVAAADANVESVTILEKDASTGQIHLTVAVTGRNHLSRVMRKIRQLKPLIKVSRSKG